MRNWGDPEPGPLYGLIGGGVLFAVLYGAALLVFAFVVRIGG